MTTGVGSAGSSAAQAAAEAAVALLSNLDGESQFAGSSASNGQTFSHAPVPHALVAAALPHPAGSNDVQLDLVNPRSITVNPAPAAKVACFAIGRVGAQRAISITNEDPAIQQRYIAEAQAAYQTIVTHVRETIRAQLADDVDVNVNVTKGYATVILNGVEQPTFPIHGGVPAVQAALDKLNEIQASMRLVSSANRPQFSDAKALGNEKGAASFEQETDRLKALKNMTFEVFESTHLDALLDKQYPGDAGNAAKDVAKTKIKARLAKANVIHEQMKASFDRESAALNAQINTLPEGGNNPAAAALIQQIQILEQLKKKLEADVFESCLGLCFDIPEAQAGETALQFQERRLEAAKAFGQVVENVLVAQGKRFYSFIPGYGTGELEAVEKEYVMQVCQMALPTLGDKILVVQDKKMAKASFVEHAIVRPTIDCEYRDQFRLGDYRTFEETGRLGTFLDRLPDALKAAIKTDFVAALNEPV